MITQGYNHIRKALVGAVHDVHISYASVLPKTLTCIGNELKRYDFVYSTNYDLLVYWSAMKVGIDNFKDYFWSNDGRFSLSNLTSYDNATMLLFVHGALHIHTDVHENTCKLTAKSGETILEQFSDGKTIPVFVAEGHSHDKISAIQQSDYLTFAYLRLSQHSGPLVILGQSLGDSDQHIVKAICDAAPSDIAIGIYSPNEDKDEIIKQKVHYRKCFPKTTLHFFDSTTHPIGDPSLKVVP